MVIRNSIIEQMSDEWTINALVESARQYYAEFCFTLKPKTLSEVSTVNIILKPNLIFNELEVRLSDVNLHSGRHIVAHGMSHKGNRIVINNSQKNITPLFYIEMSQEIYVKEDTSKNCTNYPNNEYETYNKCDRKSALSDLSKRISSQFYPHWAAASNNFSRVTTTPVFMDITNSSSAYLTHINYLAGITTTHCQLPCQVTKTFTKFITNQKGAQSGISVSFNQEMQVTQTNLVQFSPIKCLCDMGGKLGLWLGLGALQLAEVLVTAARVAGRRLAGNKI